MAEFSTPIIDFDKLPREIIDRIKPLLLLDEIVQLCIYDNQGARSYTYLVTNQKIIEIKTLFDSKAKIHYFEELHTYFLHDIFQVHELTHHIASDRVDYHDIEIRFGGEGFYTIRLDPKTAKRFEEVLINLLSKLKQHN